MDSIRTQGSNRQSAMSEIAATSFLNAQCYLQILLNAF
jgi:hypothetical protein